jgi:hypothetical protein
VCAQTDIFVHNLVSVFNIFLRQNVACQATFFTSQLRDLYQWIILSALEMYCSV